VGVLDATKYNYVPLRLNQLQIINDSELVNLAAMLSSFSDRVENVGSNWELVDALNLMLELVKHSMWAFSIVGRSL
jgi:hypothetical protein